MTNRPSDAEIRRLMTEGVYKAVETDVLRRQQEQRQSDERRSWRERQERQDREDHEFGGRYYGGEDHTT